MFTQQHSTQIIPFPCSDIRLHSNSILDGNGITITMNDDRSIINATKINNVLIKNITIRYLTDEPLIRDAIKLTSSINIIFDNVNITSKKGVKPKGNNNDTPSAINCYYCEDIIVRNSSLQFGCDIDITHPGTAEVTKAYGNGIKFFHVTRGVIINNRISSCATGVYTKLAENLTIRDNHIHDIHRWSLNDFGKGGCGILFSPCHDSTIDNNDIYNCEEHGIYLAGSKYNRIVNNNIYDNNGNGIQLNKGSGTNLKVSHNIINGNIVRDNDMNGIALLRYAYYNVVNGNVCPGNVRKAIQQSMGDSYFPREEWSKGNRVGYNVTK